MDAITLWEDAWQHFSDMTEYIDTTHCRVRYVENDVVYGDVFVMEWFDEYGEQISWLGWYPQK
jgi:hypothetical protein